MSVSVLWLFFAVPWAGLQCVIMVFSDHAPLLFHTLIKKEERAYFISSAFKIEMPQFIIECGLYYILFFIIRNKF